MKDMLPRMRSHQQAKRVKVLHAVNNIVLTLALLFSFDLIFFVTIGLVNKIVCAVFTLVCIYLFTLSKRVKVTN